VPLPERNRPGRPPLDREHDSVQICVSVPDHQYDELYAKAREQRVSVPEVIRRTLAKTARRPSD
jgi:hypothetical protein